MTTSTDAVDVDRTPMGKAAKRRSRRRPALLVVTVLTAVVSLFAAAQPASAMTVNVGSNSVSAQSKTFELQRNGDVTGNATLILYSNGDYNFHIHAHNGLTLKQDYSFLFVVQSGSGQAFTFSHKGTLGGCCSGGSRTDDQAYSGNNPAIAADFGNIQAYQHIDCRMSASSNLSGLWTGIKDGLEVISTVVSIVGALV
jgi:hypothetical protein